jgi:hypothetical protein
VLSQLAFSVCDEILTLTVLQQVDQVRTKQLAERLINGINSQVEHVIRNGDVNGYAGCINLSFAYVEVCDDC